jgi:hypothetical protein
VFLSLLILFMLVASTAKSKSFWVDVNGNPLDVEFEDVDKNQQDVMDWDFKTGTPSKVVRGSLDEHVDR